MRRVIFMLLLIVTSLGGQGVLGDERILSFDSMIAVQPDGALRVTETIRVRAEGRQIKRGIYRDFPTRYKDHRGANYIVDFDVLAVSRDGRPEPYFTKPLKNGMRTYIGQKNVMLRPGEYTYTLTYRTSRQLGFFENHDELYWNVTGNGWSFPIDRASAEVILPKGVPSYAIRHQGYTGRQGERGTDYRSGISHAGNAVFTTARPLGAYEGLTVVAMWPKGFVEEPGAATRAGWFFSDNAALLTGSVGVLALLTFYILAWRALGKDPRAGVIFPRYEPPEGFSPASMRFIKRMAYDPKTFATALVNLAVKGFVQIKEDGDTYTIERKNGTREKLAPGESVLLEKLLVANSQKLDNEHHERIGDALKAHERSLRKDYERIYFNTNVLVFITGAFISAVVFFATVWLSVDSVSSALFAVIALAMVGFGVGKGLVDLQTRLPAAAAGRPVLGYVLVILSAAGFAAGLAFAFVMLEALIRDPWPRIGILLLSAALLGVNALFYHWMKAPTRAGRKLLDRIDGFQEYLSVAEEDDLKLRNPPRKTPRLFERFLPYAMALDVEELWGDKFASVLDAARRERAYTEPAWYRGSRWHNRGPAGFAGAVASSLAVSTAAASSPPGSSGSGGGSSGGGGGGGGGGGW